MSLWKIAWRSMQQRALSSWLTGLSMALGVALVVIVLVIHSVVARSFTEAAQGYHLIVGAKGGKLQLVLNTVFHLSQPIENIPYSFYKEFTTYQDEDGNTVTGRYASTVNVVVPYCLGDSYRDFRVVGTTPDMFSKLSYGAYDDGSPKMYQFAAGENFKTEDFSGAVIGAVAAYKAGLKVGDKFPITHGLADEENAHIHEEDLFHVVGILAPTGTPNDRAVFVNMEGFYLIGDHAKPAPQVEPDDDTDRQKGPDADHHEDEHDNESAKGHEHADEEDPEHDHANDHAHDHAHDHATGREPLPENQREVTALLLELKSDLYSRALFTSINEGNVAQAVFPVSEVTKLFEGIVGNIQKLLLALAVLVVIVAGIGVMVSIYNSMSERGREIAVMRALGAGRFTVMMVILIESIMLSLLGGEAGLLLGHGAIAVLSPWVVSETGVAVHFFQYEITEVILIPFLVVLASLVGFLPALAAYRTDVARALSATP